MSDASADFNIREQLVRIDKSIAETRKFVAEHDKLAAEAQKFNRERVLSPWLAVAAISGGIGGTVAGVAAILRLAGIVH